MGAITKAARINTLESLILTILNKEIRVCLCSPQKKMEVRPADSEESGSKGR